VSHICLDLIAQFAYKAPKPLLFRGCVTYGSHLVRDSFFLGPAVDEAAEAFENAQGAFAWLTPDASDFYEEYLAEVPNLLRTQLSHPQSQLPSLAERLMKGLAVYAQLNREEVEPIVAWWNQLSKEARSTVAPIVVKHGYDLWRNDDLIRNYPMELKTGGLLNVGVLNPLYRVSPASHADVQNRMLASFNRKSLDVLLKKQNTNRFLNEASRITCVNHKRILARLQQIRTEVKDAIGSSF
jgi:hypothetical protein